MLQVDRVVSNDQDQDEKTSGFKKEISYVIYINTACSTLPRRVLNTAVDYSVQTFSSPVKFPTSEMSFLPGASRN